VPGFDEVVKKIYGFIGERGCAADLPADAVRVGRPQFPRLNHFYTEHTHVHGLARARAVRIADAVRQRRGVRHGSALIVIKLWHATLLD